jgi:hypothetical protein
MARKRPSTPLQRRTGHRKQTRAPVPRPASRALRPALRSPRSAHGVDVSELASLQAEVERLRSLGSPPRWNADPDDVRRSVAKLVLTLVEAIRQLLERQAIRRMENGTLTDTETEAIGLALMRLEDAVRDIAAQFGLEPEDLNLDLGPIGKLV